MSISMRRVRAIMVKDYKEFTRNYAISIVMLFPLPFAYLYKDMDILVFSFILNFTFAMLSCFMQAALIAEEKERNTLRSLMLTPATTMDVLIGKSSLVFMVSAVMLAAVTFIYGYEPNGLWVFLTAMVISTILYTAAGTICGLFSKSVMEASLSVFPVLILFTAAPFGFLLVDDFPIFKVLEYAPSTQLMHLVEMLTAGYSVEQAWKPLLIMLVWAVVLQAVSIVLYQKRLKDE